MNCTLSRSSGGNNLPSLNDTFHHDLPAWVFSDDGAVNHLDRIATFKNNTRHILVASTVAMKEVISFTGCMNGDKASKLLTHRLEAGIDIWKIECISAGRPAAETVIFRLKDGENQIQNYETNVRPLLKKADSLYQRGLKKDAVAIYEQLLLNEPALPGARFHAGAFYLEQNDCRRGLPHVKIFLRIFPSYKQRKELTGFTEQVCKGLF